MQAEKDGKVSLESEDEEESDDEEEAVREAMKRVMAIPSKKPSHLPPCKPPDSGPGAGGGSVRRRQYCRQSVEEHYLPDAAGTHQQLRVTDDDQSTPER